MDPVKRAKAMILNTDSGEQIPVMYNPEEYKLDHANNFAEIGVPGLPAPPLQFVRGKGRTLTMELFFDTYELGEDVRRYAGQVVRLLDVNPRTKAPPVLVFAMGQFAFRCVLTDCGQRYTMFLADGTPVRATLSVRFQEFARVEIEIERGLFVGPPTLHDIGGSQTLSSLAGDYLGDPGRWREIAEANGIDDPFRIPAGQPLVIPPGNAGPSGNAAP